mmetsp:Transcript_28362/g.74847  ORF Transcript_28362/g.74847 Transcript_28362/m.74847 type:complete len:340 (+) Transcript_28362:2302-3321(+)
MGNSFRSKTSRSSMRPSAARFRSCCLSSGLISWDSMVANCSLDFSSTSVNSIVGIGNSVGSNSDSLQRPRKPSKLRLAKHNASLCAAQHGAVLAGRTRPKPAQQGSHRPMLIIPLSNGKRRLSIAPASIPRTTLMNSFFSLFVSRRFFFSSLLVSVTQTCRSSGPCPLNAVLMFATCKEFSWHFVTKDSGFSITLPSMLLAGFFVRLPKRGCWVRPRDACLARIDGWVFTVWSSLMPVSPGGGKPLPLVLPLLIKPGGAGPLPGTRGGKFGPFFPRLPGGGPGPLPHPFKGGGNFPPLVHGGGPGPLPLVPLVPLTGSLLISNDPSHAGSEMCWSDSSL